ncbi:hypothetical protein [Nitrosopumilus ureiphilus]|uniref:Uncharacterized protein n=1 Tax=Nitrosopumilus ureiphilus TaxID=1470067 RepID=A0A7D5M361_9ARCH|nr:hypothetical protein [Nitrosopumilus ureiphilus]QLH06026.1 hypothetical protein C5F50_02230 [Nitrosopumilus ureiphilus]
MKKHVKINSIFLFVLILAGSVVTNNFSNVHAQNPNLYVSAENSQFQNRVSGPQVIEVVIRDQNISDTDEGKGEPDVTINGKDLRMIQATDGNWYGYFSDRKQAQIADSTVGMTGKGLDFGTFCSRNTSILGVSVSDTEGIAIPVSGSGIGGENGINPPNQILQDCSLSSPYSKNSINVVRQAKAMNPGTGNVKLGQIGLVSQDLWPFIQLYDFSKGGNVIIQYNRGGGPQQTILTFDTAEKLVKHELDRSIYPRSSDVNLKITDLTLNIDPTDEDSWSFGTSSSNPSTYYLLYEESGKLDSDGTAGAVNLVPYLNSMMFKDNGVLKINPNTQGQTNVITIKDNDNSETNGDGEIDISLISTASGSIGAGKQPVTITETTPNSGIFTTYDPNNDSVLITTQNAQRGTSATIDYNKKPITLLIGFGKGTISLDEKLKGTEWNSGEEMPVILVDSDSNKNNLEKEDLDLFNPAYKAIPALSTGDPFTLGESGVGDASKIQSSFLSGFTLTPVSDKFTLTSSNLGTNTKTSVEKFSDRARIDPITTANINALVIDLKAPLKELYNSINNPFDSSKNFRGLNMFNYDIRSLNSTIDNVDIYLLVDESSSGILDSSGNPTNNLSAIKIVSDNRLQNLINLNSTKQVSNPQTLHSNLFSQSFTGNEPIGLLFTFTPIQNIGTQTRPIVADFFSYGILNDGLSKQDRIANQIVRVEMEELTKNSGKFRGSLEYIMLNQLNIFDSTTYEKIIPIDDEPVFLMIDELKGNDAPRINYDDLGTDGVQTAVSDQQDVLTHMGIVVLSVKTFKPGDTVGVNLFDKDLNVDSDLVDIYTVVDPAKFPGDLAADTIGLPNLGQIKNEPFGRLLEITFDDERWLKSTILHNGKSCLPISKSDGLASTGFTLVETGRQTGEFVGNFKIPAQYCSRNDGGIVKSTTGVDIGARYYDFRGQSSQAAITSASASVGATSGIVKLDRTSYPVPIGSVSDFFNSGKSSSTGPDGRSIFPYHLTAITKNGDTKSIDSGEEIGPKDTILYVQIHDADYNLSPNGEDKISQNIVGSNGPVKVLVNRGSSSVLLATAGGEEVKQGVITIGKSIKSGVTRELGPIVETAPGSGIFQFNLPIRYVDGPASTKCPVTPDSGFTKLDKTKTGILSRFDLSPSSGSYCIMQGDVITVEYSDQTDASGSQRTVTSSAAFDLRIGTLQSDRQSYIIGRDALITLIDPDLNFDAKKAETHSLDVLEWDSDNVRVTMGNLGGTITQNGKIFDSRPFGLRETGDSTGIFQTIIEIPSQIDGKPLDRDETIEITYTDWGTAGSDFVGQNDQKIELKFYTSNFQSLITLDKKVYSWTDKVYVTIVAPDHNFDVNKIDEIGTKSTNEIKISTRSNKLSQYKLVETGTDTGIFTGEIIMTGFKHDADGNPRTGDIDGMDTMPRTEPKSNGGPTNGFLESKNDDGLTVSFQYSDKKTTTSSALIRWNIGTIEWVQGITSANGDGIIRVIDPDMNLNPETVNNFSIDVWSDSDLGGIDLTVTETGQATGIFEGYVTFSTNDQSSGSRLRVNEGDYVTARYEDHTLPKPYTRADELKISSNTIVGPVVPSLERVPIFNPRIVDSFGSMINQVKVDQQIQITADISNNNITNQPFTYLIQIRDSSNTVTSLSWISGNLEKEQSFSPSVSWIPANAGNYSTTVFVWNSLDNPIALSPVVEFTINVI